MKYCEVGDLKSSVRWSKLERSEAESTKRAIVSVGVHVYLIFGEHKCM